MYKIQKNPSAIRSQNRIMNTLLSLLKSDFPYSEVTISELSRRAKVVRKTFYSNFDNKDDILTFILDRAFELFMKNINLEDSSFSSIFFGLYSFLLKHKDWLKIFYQNNLIYFAQLHITKHIIDSKVYFQYKRLTLSEDKYWYYKYLPSQVMSAVCTTISNWIENDFQETPKQLGKLSEDLLLGRLWTTQVNS
jgi:AcrR family transcriptional regulator